MDNAAARSDTVNFTCRRCGRPVGQAVLACPELGQGECPFRKRVLGSWKTRLRLAGVAIFFILLLIWFVFGAGGIERVVGVVSMLCIIALFLFVMLNTTTVLHDPISRLTWRRDAVLLGITVRRTLIAGSERLPIVLPLPPSLAFPPSVITLADVATRPRQKSSISQATALFRSAILGLLARGMVHICRYRSYADLGSGKFKHDPDIYTLALNPEADWRSVQGALELKIAQALNDWTSREDEETQLWPETPPIYELVRAIYEKDALSAEQWAIDLVAQDAAGRGWGLLNRRRWGVKRFEPGQALSERLPSERASLDAWSSQLAQAYPEFSEALNRKIGRGILSRQASN